MIFNKSIYKIYVSILYIVHLFVWYTFENIFYFNTLPLKVDNHYGSQLLSMLFYGLKQSGIFSEQFYSILSYLMQCCLHSCLSMYNGLFCRQELTRTKNDNIMVFVCGSDFSFAKVINFTVIRVYGCVQCNRRNYETNNVFLILY